MEKPKELGLFNVYTEEGQVRIQTDSDGAFLANKFPEALDVYRNSFSEIFEDVKAIRTHSEALSKQYTRLYEQIVNYDIVQKEWAWVEDDFNILHGAQGFIKLSNFYTFLADSFYDCLRRRLTFTADINRYSFQELWD